MKINWFDGVSGVEISRLNCGDTFMDERRSVPGESGLYMKVCPGNFLATEYGRKCYAINLANGNMKFYQSEYKVTPIKTEVNFVKG